jgi:S-adenosylmethionine-diacylglycerol 3-amino-3-carboxypropyl transferase
VKFNLSDIFEYMSPENYQSLLERLIASSRPGSRLAYWNMLAPRTRPQSLANRLQPMAIAERLFDQDKAWFYSRLVVEEVIG